jgi:hypothetical protein
MKISAMAIVAATALFGIGLCAAAVTERTPVQMGRVLHAPGQKVATTCILSGQQPSGTNKICVYECGGTTVTETVSASSECPQSVNR